MADDPRDALSEAELLAATAVTRAKVADDVAALVAKLSAQNIEAEAKQAAVRLWDGAVADLVSRAHHLRRRLTVRVRQHRVPLLMVGALTLGLLIWRSRRARALARPPLTAWDFLERS